MGIETMGKVLVTAKVENLKDLHLAEQGVIPSIDVRLIEIMDALIGTGAPAFSMPKRLIEQLGLTPGRVRKAMTSAGTVSVQTYGAVRITIQGRDCISDVAEVPEECPVLVGQIPLESLDFVIDPRGQKLIGNPAHGGEHVLELY